MSNRLQVGRDEAIRIGQKSYYDPSYCKKGLGHSWVKIRGNTQSCYECGRNAIKRISFKKDNGITVEQLNNSKAIREIEKKREDIALSKLDDYDFDFDDEFNFLENSDEQ